MTEAEWLACDDPFAMLHHLGVEASGRKLRLLCCACWRCQDEPGRTPQYLAAVEAAELFAEGFIGNGELRAARDGARLAGGKNSAYWCAALTSTRLDAYRAAGRVLEQLSDLAFSPDDRPWRLTRYCRLFADIVGNPFRPATLERHRVAVPLARAAYDERRLPSGELDPLRLSILADALEEAGASEGVVAHLRSPGSHVRGCWAVDLVLGRG